MRIAILAPSQRSCGFLTSAERHARDLYKGLVADGIDVCLYPSSQGPVIDCPPSDFHHAASELGIRESCIAEIITTTELFEMSRDFDLIHSHSHLLSLGYSRLVEIPVLATIHDQPGPEALPLLEKLDGNTYYVSTSNSDRVPQLTYMGTVYNGIDVSSYPLRSRELEETILFVGNLKPDNGIEDALEIARLSSHKLILAGRVQDHGYVQRLGIQSPIETEIVDICKVDESQRASIYCGAKALVLPRGIDDPFRYAVLESLACGTPVISRHSDFLGEILAARATTTPTQFRSPRTGAVPVQDRAVPAIGLAFSTNERSVSQVAPIVSTVIVTATVGYSFRLSTSRIKKKAVRSPELTGR